MAGQNRGGMCSGCRGLTGKSNLCRTNTNQARDEVFVHVLDTSFVQEPVLLPILYVKHYHSVLLNVGGKSRGLLSTVFWKERERFHRRQRILKISLKNEEQCGDSVPGYSPSLAVWSRPPRESKPARSSHPSPPSATGSLTLEAHHSLEHRRSSPELHRPIHPPVASLDGCLQLARMQRRRRRRWPLSSWGTLG